MTSLDSTGAEYYPYWCPNCNDYVATGNAPDGHCGGCGVKLWLLADVQEEYERKLRELREMQQKQGN